MIGFQRLRVFVCNCSTIVRPKKAYSRAQAPGGSRDDNEENPLRCNFSPRGSGDRI